MGASFMIWFQVLASGLSLSGYYALLSLGFALIFSTFNIFHIAHAAVFLVPLSEQLPATAKLGALHKRRVTGTTGSVGILCAHEHFLVREGPSSHGYRLGFSLRFYLSLVLPLSVRILRFSSAP